MVVIGEAVIDEHVTRDRFACDVGKCKGACCTVAGGRGAPLEDSELGELERAFPFVRKYLPPVHLQALERGGLYEGRPGSFATRCVNNRECVFVFYDEGVARCSFERAFHAGEIAWRKPISCHLFPIRVARGTPRHLRTEMIPECNPGVERGETEDTPLVVFLKEPLVRAFGEQWYGMLKDAADKQ